MADCATDSSIPQYNAPAHGRNQRTPSHAQGQPKRNNRNRKNHSQNDGTVSDGAIVHPAPKSPRSKKSNKQKPQSIAMGAPAQQDVNVGRIDPQKARPVSIAGGMIPNSPANDYEKAYAGATFQASPAASSLPKPKFLSKSIPNGPARPSLHSRLSGEQTAEESTSSPESNTASPAQTLEPPQSPLDMFFKADRAEKERNRIMSNVLSPESARAPRPTTSSGTSFQRPNNNGKSIFLAELDGDGTEMPSPRPVPMNGRPTAGERAYSSPSVPVRPESEEERQANTRSLKDLLFNTAANATPPQSRNGRMSGSHTPEGVFGPPSPFNGSGASTPQPASEQQNHYSLHYGNRNLSPLFKATTKETPTRPSGLRQEMPNGRTDMRTPSHPASDMDAFARSYLKEQIRVHAPAEMPQFSFNDAARPAYASGSAYGPGPAPNPVQPFYQHQGPPVPASTTPRNGGARDIGTMENDLRRMLKLHVLS